MEHYSDLLLFEHEMHIEQIVPRHKRNGINIAMGCKESLEVHVLLFLMILNFCALGAKVFLAVVELVLQVTQERSVLQTSKLKPLREMTTTILVSRLERLEVRNRHQFRNARGVVHEFVPNMFICAAAEHQIVCSVCQGRIIQVSHFFF